MEEIPSVKASVTATLQECRVSADMKPWSGGRALAGEKSWPLENYGQLLTVVTVEGEHFRSSGEKLGCLPGREMGLVTKERRGTEHVLARRRRLLRTVHRGKQIIRLEIMKFCEYESFASLIYHTLYLGKRSREIDQTVSRHAPTCLLAGMIPEAIEEGV